MLCERTRERLSAYLDNELDPMTALDVAKHLENCPPCRRECDLLAAIDRTLKQAVAAREADLDVRADRINAAVRARILGEIGDDPVIEPPRANVVPLERPRLRRGLRRFAVMAASFAVVVLLGLFGLISYLHNEGPLLAATAHNHTVCRRIERTNLGWAKGDKAAELMGSHGLRCPNLEGMGLTFEAVHNCTVSGKPFVHLMFVKDGKQVSVYYGGKETVTKLRESVGPDITPGKMYLSQTDGVGVAAFATGECLWMVAGEIPPKDLEAVAGYLRTSVMADAARR